MQDLWGPSANRCEILPHGGKHVQFYNPCPKIWGVQKILGAKTWLFRKCSLELAPVVTHLVNFSLNLGHIPDIWHTAIVTFIPKVSQPTDCGDYYRPISVTPIMSRIVEKIVVRTWLCPSIPAELLTNQYGFRPTGSTTAALIHLFHSITRILESCSYVASLRLLILLIILS